jgi:hypothetical protein
VPARARALRGRGELLCGTVVAVVLAARRAGLAARRAPGGRAARNRARVGSRPGSQPDDPSAHLTGGDRGASGAAVAGARGVPLVGAGSGVPRCRAGVSTPGAPPARQARRRSRSAVRSRP